jgi:hypothetical protein
MEIIIVKSREVMSMYDSMKLNNYDFNDEEFQNIMELYKVWLMEKNNHSETIQTNLQNVDGGTSKKQKINLRLSNNNKKGEESVSSRELFDGNELVKDLTEIRSKIGTNLDEGENGDGFIKNKTYVELCDKYGLKQLEFNNARIKSQYYAIVVKSISIYKVFEYIEHLESLDTRVTIDFLETSSKELFILKYYVNERPDFKTNKRFKFVKLDGFLQVRIHKIDECKRHIFIDEFMPKNSSLSNSLAAEYMGDVVSGNASHDKIKVLEMLLKSNYKTLKFKYINEFNFSLMMAMVLSAFSNKSKSKSFIYSFEKAMIIGEFNRRCDAIYIHENSIVILEFKSNVNKKENPLEYINDREYVNSVLSYFKEYEPDILKEITIIRQIGLEFFGQNKKHKVKITLADDINMNFNQSNENTPTFVGRKRQRNKIQKKKQNQSMYIL